MAEYKIQKFPKTRIATIDVCEISNYKNHITGLIEIDVTESRDKIKKYRKEINQISFTAWLIKVISDTIKEYESAASYLKGKSKIAIFNNINVSIVVEKESNGQKVPIPLIIEKANERTIESIYEQINDAQNIELTDKDIVLQSKSNRLERFYYYLPGFLRRCFWKYLLKHPHYAFNKMGNVAVTSIGMMGKINGWFIPKSIHPICFGIGSIIQKPVVIKNEIVIREMLNMTILLDHDVIDGADMARFINTLTKNIENGICL
jgi:pyruvate/2-oxoglutarate dehydrogenase complex dihydrolipoamide acyltransferase (E2) component